MKDYMINNRNFLFVLLHNMVIRIKVTVFMSLRFAKLRWKYQHLGLNFELKIRHTAACVPNFFSHQKGFRKNGYTAF